MGSCMERAFCNACVEQFLVMSGGLAAPAIASGIGAAITLAGGGAAAAAGATGFLATTAGTAAVVSSMGVAGGSYAGTHMARRIGAVPPVMHDFKLFIACPCMEVHA